MRIGTPGTSNYCPGYRNNRVIQKERTKSFGNTTVNSTANIVIHGFMGEKTETGV